MFNTACILLVVTLVQLTLVVIISKWTWLAAENMTTLYGTTLQNEQPDDNNITAIVVAAATLLMQKRKWLWFAMNTKQRNKPLTTSEAVSTASSTLLCARHTYCPESATVTLAMNRVLLCPSTVVTRQRCVQRSVTTSRLPSRLQ